MVVLFALGLLAKPSVITFPFVLLLLDYWPLGRMTGTPHKVAAKRMPPQQSLARWCWRNSRCSCWWPFPAG